LKISIPDVFRISVKMPMGTVLIAKKDARHKLGAIRNYLEFGLNYQLKTINAYRIDL
jgi:hypothetical protein